MVTLMTTLGVSAATHADLSGSPLREGEPTSGLLSGDESEFHRLAEPLNDTLATLEGSARHEGRSVPSETEVRQVTQAFWDLMAQLRALPNAAGSRRMLQTAVHPWLMRSRYWNHAFVKPHGYAGDYRMLELMYDLEHANCLDPTRSAIENCLDQVFATVDSVRGIWGGRRVFRDVVLAEAWEHDRPVRVLDVGCGGARYLADVARTIHEPGRLLVTLIDQDPAALVFAAQRLRLAGAQVTAICQNVRHLQLEQLPAVEYDVVLSVGLFDYLPDDDAQRLLCVMETASAPHGVVTICNFSTADRSRVVNDWIVEWPRIYRDEAALGAIWPYGPAASISASPDGSLLYASRRW